VQFFGVVLAFEDPSDVGRPGQRVRARLRLADVDDAITVPRQAIEREGDQAFVWVLDDDEPSRRAVTLGPASLGRVVIAEGLAVGERVLLEPPSRAAELARVDAEDQP
jgi:multidrug efflux pump subunit AcrA (membrane-fusion protein)